MDRNSILILGGYGYVGACTARELLATTALPLTIAGRNRKRGASLARTLGQRVQSVYADACDKASLLEAMASACLTINCAGPSSVFNETIAEAALESGCHYIDVSGYQEATAAMQTWHEKIRSGNFIFCTSAGVLPGLVSILPGYLSGLMESVDSLDVAFIFNDILTDVSARDSINQFNKSEMEIYRNGRWRKGSLFDLKKVAFPSPFGTKWCAPSKVYDLVSIPDRYQIPDFSFYAALQSDVMSILAVMVWYLRHIKSQRLSRAMAWGLRQLSAATSRRGPRGYAIKALAKGRKSGRDATLTFSLFQRDMYLGTGMTAAITARMILESEAMRPGAFYMNECIDPAVFMKHLAARGLDYHIAES
jgi:saccharopine dehydrogenase-like NADP-dependent oxidoreductase